MAATGTSGATTEPSSGDVTVSTDGCCGDLTTLVRSNDDFGNALCSGDAATIERAGSRLPALVEAVQSSEPAGIADTVVTAAELVDPLTAAFDGLDIADEAAVNAALASLTPNPDAETHTNCWRSTPVTSAATSLRRAPTPLPTPRKRQYATCSARPWPLPRPSGCRRERRGGDVNLPGFATNVENNDGTALEVDLGGLPSTSFVAAVPGLVSVTVFEAPIPFTVGFSGDGIDPAHPGASRRIPAQVAAAEAVLAAQG